MVLSAILKRHRGFDRASGAAYRSHSFVPSPLNLWGQASVAWVHTLCLAPPGCSAGLGDTQQLPLQPGLSLNCLPAGFERDQESKTLTQKSRESRDFTEQKELGRFARCLVDRQREAPYSFSVKSLLSLLFRVKPLACCLACCASNPRPGRGDVREQARSCISRFGCCWASP